MFSEYASRFLAQSQARPSTTHPHDDNSPRYILDRRRRPSDSRYLQRSTLGNPYQPTPSYLSRFSLSGIRNQDVQAPLFNGEGLDFEDDEEQHEREMADYIALRESRRNFGSSSLKHSSEPQHGRSMFNVMQGHARSQRSPKFDRLVQSPRETSNRATKANLIDVDLASTIRESAEDTIDQSDNESPPRIIRMAPVHDDSEAQIHQPPQSMQYSITPESDSVPQTVVLNAPTIPKHDPAWAHLFQIALFAMFATFVLVWLHTNTPTSKDPIGDTIYSALSGSINLLLWDTVITVVVALVWLALLREYVRALMLTLLVAVPVVLVSFSIYPFVSSFQGAWNGSSIQDKAMRWLAFIPAIMAGVWVASVYSGRHSLGKAINILEFACRIVSQSPALILLGFATLSLIVSFTWIWLSMFTRVFLGGHISKVKTFVIDFNTWWLGFFFIMVYLWTLGVIAGVQRATSAATVSQWYFHRLNVPSPSSNQVVKASLLHAIGPLLGSICLSTFLALLIRLPLILLPRRLASLVTLCAYSIVPTSLAALTNPLTLTYSAIHSQPLSISARGLSELHFVSKTNPSTTINPTAYAATSGSTLVPYRLAKLLLDATRFVMSFALGFGGWISVAHNIRLAGGGIKGSLYGYLVGLMAATIGWAVLGAIEGVIGGVVDASVICWASETGGQGGANEARYCREAGELFGDDD